MYNQFISVLFYNAVMPSATSFSSSLSEMRELKFVRFSLFVHTPNRILLTDTAFMQSLSHSMFDVSRLLWVNTVINAKDAYFVFFSLESSVVSALLTRPLTSAFVTVESTVVFFIY